MDVVASGYLLLWCLLRTSVQLSVIRAFLLLVIGGSLKSCLHSDLLFLLAMIMLDNNRIAVATILKCFHIDLVFIVIESTLVASELRIVVTSSYWEEVLWLQ